MAIGPESLKENFLNEVNSFENQIDYLLCSKQVSDDSQVNIPLHKCNVTMTHSHFQILKERYITAGWADVKWTIDQIKGDWLTFYSPKKIL